MPSVPIQSLHDWPSLTSIMLLAVVAVLFLHPFPASLADSSSNSSNSSPPALLGRFCSDVRANDPQEFDVHFVDTMETVSRRVSDVGFGFATSGNGTSNQVYGMGQCFGYLSSIDCRLCYAESRVKLPACLPADSARVFLEGCFLAYAGHNFSSQPVDQFDDSLCGVANVSGDAGSFGSAVSGLVRNLTSEASGRSNYYVVGSGKASSKVEIFGMAQCWRSLNATGCRTCLEDARRRAIGCLPASDGRALNAGCYVRYSTQSFYETPLHSSGKSSAFRRRLGVALGCVAASLLVILGAVIWTRRTSKARKHEYADRDGISEFLRSISESHLCFKYEDLLTATDNFDQRNKLGQGGYGSVYKGVLADGREIAVKRLFFNTRQWVDQFFNEVNLISQVQHKNLVKLFGCSIEGPESLLVYEYLPNISLDQYLFDAFKKKELNWPRRYNIILGTAEGLAYLHEASQIKIIHRDIKASNILLDEKFRAKISDFGLARYIGEDQSHLSTGLAGTLGYMAPEYVVHGQLTEKADIYSYGILVLEVITGRKNSSLPTSEGNSLMAVIWNHYKSKTLIELLDPDLHDECSGEEAQNMFHVGLLCTQASPNLRPPMWKVVEMLSSSSRSLPLPSQPPFINLKVGEFRSDGSETSSSSNIPVSVNQISISIDHGR